MFIIYLGASFSIIIDETSQLFNDYSGSYLLFLFSYFFQDGPRNTIIKIAFQESTLIINLIGILLLGLTIFIIWKKLLNSTKRKNIKKLKIF